MSSPPINDKHFYNNTSNALQETNGIGALQLLAATKQVSAAGWPLPQQQQQQLSETRERERQLLQLQYHNNNTNHHHQHHHHRHHHRHQRQHQQHLASNTKAQHTMMMPMAHLSDMAAQLAGAGTGTRSSNKRPYRWSGHAVNNLADSPLPSNPNATAMEQHQHLYYQGTTDTNTSASTTITNPRLTSNKMIKLSRSPQLFNCLRPNAAINAAQNNTNTSVTKDDTLAVRTPANNTNNNHSITGNPSGHLVRSVSDLPVFVTIEGYRVASYSLAGEPHLCLPQLLQCLRQKFAVTRMIEKFEEYNINFISASPLQLEGFIKASVMPSGAESCPMVKRSDADRVCSALYEQCFKGRYNNIVDICSASNADDGSGGSDGPALKKQESSTDSDQKPHGQQQKQQEAQQEEKPQEAQPQEAQSQEPPQPQEAQPPDPQPQEPQEPQLQQQQQECVKKEDEEQQSPPPPHAEKPQTQTQQQQNLTKKGPLFESEAQNSILALAKAITSTLMVRVYHRCFGKCLGIYYPSLLTSSRADCIECVTCHIMLTPRRFVGHTHGPKENDVCHWGFNSYNWRHYIRLSRKQPMNNLDEDELLVQFKTLQAAPDFIDHGDDDHYDFDKPDPEEELKLLLENSTTAQNKGFHRTTAQKQKVRQAPQQPPQPPPPPPPPLLPPPPPPPSATTNPGSNPNLSLPDQYRYCPQQNATYPAGNLSAYGYSTSQLTTGDPYFNHRVPGISLSAPLELTKYGISRAMDLPTMNPECYKFVNHMTMNSHGPILKNENYMLKTSSRDQQSISRRSSSFSAVDNSYWVMNRSLSMAEAAIKLNQELLTDPNSDTLIKREVDFCTSLTSYLNEKGLGTNLLNDIVENTLNMARKSRVLL